MSPSARILRTNDTQASGHARKDEMTASARKAWAAWAEWVGDRRRARLYASGIGTTLLMFLLLPSVWTFLLFLWTVSVVMIFQKTELFQPEPRSDESDEWF
jgi:hypothetical protein